MPRWLRVLLTGSGFAMFFTATTVLGLIALPLLLLTGNPPEHRWRFTRRLNASLKLFAGFMRDTALITYWPPALPEGFEGRPFLLVSNHPSLIDVVLTLASLPQLSCVFAARWYRSLVMGSMLRRTEYVAGPGLPGDDELDGVPVVQRIEDKLRSGIPVLVFPEGTRSAARRLRRFKRGAIEAAVRAGVPILPMFIGVSPPFLMKGQPFYDVPPITPEYGFEWLEPIDTATAGLDSRAITRRLEAAYQARFERLLEDRDALIAELT